MAEDILLVIIAAVFSSPSSSLRHDERRFGFALGNSRLSNAKQDRPVLSYQNWSVDFGSLCKPWSRLMAIYIDGFATFVGASNGITENARYNISLSEKTGARGNHP